MNFPLLEFLSSGKITSYGDISDCLSYRVFDNSYQERKIRECLQKEAQLVPLIPSTEWLEIKLTLSDILSMIEDGAEDIAVKMYLDLVERLEFTYGKNYSK